MICPRCGSEYIGGVVECPECGVFLAEVASPSEVQREGNEDPVAVFASDSASVIAIAKSLLIDAGIEFGVAGENVQDLFGYGRFPAGASVFAGPVRLLVAPRDSATAADLLVHLGDDFDLEVESAASGEDVGVGTGRTWHSTARFVAKAVAALMLGLVALEALAGLAGTLWR